MLTFLKIVHLLCLFGGGAAGVGNGILIRKVIASKAPPPPMVAQTMKMLGMTGLGSIVLLWLTGIALVQAAGGIGTLGWIFAIKLVAAAVVLAGSVALSLLGARAAKAGRPPDAQLGKRIANAISLCAVLAVILAVIVFA